MNDLASRKLITKQYLVVSSLIFGLFFGAGNVLFHLPLGELAGELWVLAMVGF